MVDASILANVIGDDGVDGHRARDEVRSAGELAAPDLVDVETVAVLRKRWIAGAMSDDRFEEAINDLEAIELERYPTLPSFAVSPRCSRSRRRSRGLSRGAVGRSARARRH